jgi:hypothetical protein
MKNIKLDARWFYAILAVVVVVSAVLMFRGAEAGQKAPLPDPNMFRSGAAKSGPSHT